ncbi:MAG: hypothetical protein IKE30_04930 [Clostridia bacterium]|nr:hypothetical protein [Clostridia bacterium]
MRNEGYVPNFKVPAKNGPSRLMKLTILLCIVLPPVGLFLLWYKVRCPLRGKALLSVLSLIALTGMLVFGIRLYKRPSVVTPISQGIYQASPNGITPTPGDVVAPANPLY